MKNVIAINASPRAGWNTAQLVREAARGVESTASTLGEAVQVDVVDLYALEPFMGCRSCFACKAGKALGACVYKDGLADVLASMREADGLILGSPIYFGQTTAGFRALHERLCFQYATYKKEVRSYNSREIPVALIMTSNIATQFYDRTRYDEMISQHAKTLKRFVGPVSVLSVGETLQTDRYEQLGWTLFDADERRSRRSEVFPQELQQAYELGAALLLG